LGSSADSESVQPAELALRAWQRIAPLVGRPWDVVYFPWNSAAIAHRPLFDWGIPIVISCRGAQVNIAPYNPQRESIRRGLQYTLQRAAAVHCVSAAIRDEITQYGVDPARVSVIRPAVDPEFFRPGAVPRTPSSQLRVVTTGSLIWRKGYEYALRAIRLLVDREIPVTLDVIGAGAERQRLLYTIDDLELHGSVRLLGQLPPADVVGRLQQADVFLLSSLSEGISNAVLEAMACGVPVVTTDCGGMREAVTHGVEGFVVPTRASQAMAESLEVLWQQPARRAQMGAAARRRIERDFRLDQQVSDFVNLITSARRRQTFRGSAYAELEPEQVAG
jgi:colanic acid/amylovoran biosynthesis glycosyltransferase